MAEGAAEQRLFLVEARVAAKPPIPLVAWGGVVAARLVKELMGGSEAVVRVSPPLSPGGGGIAYGEVLDEFVLSVLTWEPWRLVEAMGSAKGLRVLGVAVRDAAEAARREAEEARKRMSEEDGLAIVGVEYGPTAFVYRGRLVLYPSPLRLLRGGLRALTELGVINEREAEEVFTRLAGGVELLRSRVKVTRLNLGHERWQLVFQGTAMYGVEPEVAELLALVLGGARVRGVGKSRGIGLGYIRVLDAGQMLR